ncbi:murein L,D-transpeptidase catalytic domain family protein [Pseudomonas sp. RW4S2]|uniref:Murein L,D-transpeptidase catalytic domain family protein n=2 Tax=Pseudomonas vlassakiae TaxID=485888 RepID=A0A923GJI9_9PSED|nr:murein L,D-transpeptidase catalytic domain family protein [Pseudomonas vlassakiae]MBV4543168.1 murein L,D-transpeptidase catalytic domain family protein [Pseudomonas vlassakiae]
MSMFDPLRGAVRLSLASLGLFFLSAWQAAHAQPLPSAAELQQLAPNASLSTLDLALTAYACASHSEGDKLLTVIDYSKASRDKRLWVFDLRARKLLFEEWVAHGKNSGADVPTTFSNAPNSYQSSLGLYETGQTYSGKHGRSLRLQGLEPGFNDNSMSRAIVMHAAAYADPKVVPGLGRLGRSQGCPAVRPAIAGKLIDTLQRGSYVFAYYPQQEWLKKSRFLNAQSCPLANPSIASK